MRTELRDRNGKRGEFTATFSRYGRATVRIPRRGSVQVVTLLFTDVQDSTGRKVTDHIWFKTCKQWAALGLRSGERVKFEARIVPYLKGYAGRDDFGDDGDGRHTDYKLSHPTKARLVSAESIADLPLFAHAEKR